jgi:hypothetical protein
MLNSNSGGISNMRKIFNFIVLWDLIKSNDIKEDYEFYNSKLCYFYCNYYFDEKVFNSRIFFCKTIRKDSIHYEVIEGKFKFNLWNWQAKLLYKMAQNKYLKS